MEQKLLSISRMGGNIHYKWWKFLSNKIIIGMVIICCCVSPSTAQVSMGGIIIHNAPFVTLNTSSDYENGVSVIDNTLSLSITANMNWSLSLRAESHFNNNASEIQSNTMQITVQNAEYTTQPIMLSFQDQEIARGMSLSMSQTIPIDIKYSTLAGPSYLQPAGDYSTTLVFTLTMVNM